jgi:hypothetical protein
MRACVSIDDSFFEPLPEAELPPGNRFRSMVLAKNDPGRVPKAETVPGFPPGNIQFSGYENKLEGDMSASRGDLETALSLERFAAIANGLLATGPRRSSSMR